MSDVGGDRATQRVAEALLDEYDKEFDASHLTSQDFVEQAANLVALVREQIAADIEAVAERTKDWRSTDQQNVLKVAAQIARGSS